MRKSSIVLSGIIVSAACAVYLSHSRTSPEIRKVTELTKKNLPSIERGVEREIFFTPELKPRKNLEGVAAEYRKELDQALLKPVSATAPISEYAPVVRRFSTLLRDRGVAPQEQAKILSQVGKHLYNEALIRQGYDPGTQLLKIKLLKLSLAHLDGAREIATEREL